MTVPRLAALILIVFPLTAFSALKEEEETKAHAERVVKLIVDGNFESAFKEAHKHWPLPEEEVNNLAYQTRSQLTSLAGRFGYVIEDEWMKTDKVGGAFIRHQFIVKYQHHALRWIFIYYKGEDMWQLNNLTWDDKIELLFSE